MLQVPAPPRLVTSLPPQRRSLPLLPLFPLFQLLLLPLPAPPQADHIISRAREAAYEQLLTLRMVPRDPPPLPPDAASAFPRRGPVEVVAAVT